MINVQKVAADAAADASLVNELASLVNRVYAIAEDGLWTAGTSRTTPGKSPNRSTSGRSQSQSQVSGLLASSKSAGWIPARVNWGCCRRPRAPQTGRRSRLVRFAERWSQGQGLATMQLELLVPRQWRHPTKEFLKAWYSRIGYRPVRTGSSRRAIPNSRPNWQPPATSSSTTSPCQRSNMLWYPTKAMRNGGIR